MVFVIRAAVQSSCFVVSKIIEAVNILHFWLQALVFAKLTPPDLCRAACVSKQWNQVMVSDDSFWRQHYAGRPCNGCAREAFRGRLFECGCLYIV